jgi:hypothetical protein
MGLTTPQVRALAMSGAAQIVLGRRKIFAMAVIYLGTNRHWRSGSVSRQKCGRGSTGTWQSSGLDYLNGK